MLSSASRSFWENSRLPLLGLTIITIVVLPFLLLRASTEKSLDAANLVTHTREVEAAVHELTYDVRNLEAAALSLALGIDSDAIRNRIAESIVRIPVTFDTLIRLTRDNSGQQVRVGVLKATVDQRLGLVQQIVEGGDPAIRPRLITSMVTQYPIRNTAAAIVSEEQQLLGRRKAQAERLRNQTLGLTSGAMFAQLLLLGLVTYFSQRQIGRRLDAERQSHDANARAQTVLQTVREPIVLLDAQQRVMMHNTAFSELHGIEDDDAVGVPLAEVGNGVWRDTDTLQRLNDVVTRNREIWDHEQPQRTADGHERVMLVNARQMPLPDQEARAVLMTMTDITTRKAAEARINELNRQLEGKVEQVSDVNRELEAFSYSVSHDLRAPLRHIAGFADKLGKHLGDAADEKSRHYLGVIGESAKRMSTLIDDLLVYSQLGRSALRLRAVDMQSLVAETRAMLDANTDSDTPDRRIEWRIGALPILVADENMMRQVWQNLLGNAVKYSGRSDPAIIEIRHAFNDDGSHHFTVRDNGAGFDMAYAGKLFGVFQRLHKASDYPGTGIGLASVRRALLRHGGSIRADSSPDAGATFQFTLPATLNPPTSSRETPA